MEEETTVLTGGTGAFGKFLIQDILKSRSKLILLVRADSQKQAEDRIKKLFKPKSTVSNRIKILKCDLTQVNLGLRSTDYKVLKQTSTYILHAAASTKFTLPLKEARRNNVETTKRLLSFALCCESLKRFGHVSTAFIAGRRSGIIFEKEFEHNEGFLNSYQESKYEAEMHVRTMIGKLPIAIFRPSLIITPFKKSGNSPVNALTLGLFLARKGLLPIVPGNESNKLDIIEAELASKAISHILYKKSLYYSTYHITSAQNSPMIKDFINIIEHQSKKKLPIRFYGEMNEFKSELKKISRFRPDLIAIYKKTQSFLPELAFPKIYDNRNLLKELGVTSFSNNPLKAVSDILK